MTGFVPPSTAYLSSSMPFSETTARSYSLPIRLLLLLLLLLLVVVGVVVVVVVFLSSLFSSSITIIIYHCDSFWLS